MLHIRIKKAIKAHLTDRYQNGFYRSKNSNEKMHHTLKSLILSLWFLGQGSVLWGSDTLSLDLFLSDRRIKAEKMLNGVFYTIQSEPHSATSEMPRQGNFIKIAYVGKLLSGRVFDESSAHEPFVFQLGSKQVIAGLESALQRLKIGTKATLYIPAELAYGKEGLGDVIPPNAPVIYDIELLGIVSASQYAAQVLQLEDQERLSFNGRVAQQMETEQRHINDYALLHRLKAKRRPSGLNYVVTKAGTGATADTGSLVTFHYEAFFLSDQVFDETFDGSPMRLKIGEKSEGSPHLAGLDEGLTYFTEGSEGYIFIPSQLAYGGTPTDHKGYTIPAYSVLIYKVQIQAIQKEVKSTKENK
jgi:FKBP-type peptidyl-prolyl cis-trans isomerase